MRWVVGLSFLTACHAFAAEPSPSPSPCDATPEPPLPAPGTAVPRWVFEPWISKDISNRDDTYAFVDGFRTRGIPVGAVVLDSPWETQYNTFVPNPSRYGDFAGLVRDMHARDVRVVLWITPAVDEESHDGEPGGDAYAGPAPNLARGRACDAFVDEGKTYGWWKGKGAFVDFFDARARAWWHAQQNGVLDTGIDGWKLDFAESYMEVPTVRTHEGVKTLQEYSERYYEDFLTYGRSRRGPDFVTMVRAWDESYQFPGRFFARKEHAPVSWMGDNARNFVGLADALNEEFISARAGYSVVGSDVGGYRDFDDKHPGPILPFDTLVFARWVAVGALSPFMQLHGQANVTPWTVPDHVDETVALYRYWARFHHAIAPTLFDRASVPLVTPIGEPSAWPGDYRYVLAADLLVAPLLDASGKRDVALPSGSRWYDWWSTATYDGGTTVPADHSNDRRKVPLFVRGGAILKLDVDDPEDVLGLGGATFAVWPLGSSAYGGELTVDEAATSISLTAPAGSVVRVRLDAPPASVSGAESTYDAATKTLVVRPAMSPVVITR